MRLRNLFDGLAILVSVGLCGEILFRRWVWGQVPTQIGALWIYGLIALNVVVGVAVVQRLRRAVARSTGRVMQTMQTTEERKYGEAERTH